MYCLETKNLSYQFSKKENVLNSLNLQVPQGSIYGFLGPNGAGKTTSLRLVLGLLKKQQGEITFFGKSFGDHRIEILKQVGSLIESPSIYSQLTATENLKVLQKVYPCPASRIGEVLKMVGLQDTKNKKAGQFSLGMKQRLSIAIALLHSPGLLVLDEPTNGLDPNGIIEMRELLKKLNKENGITIIISSHMLAEIEKLVTHLGVIHKGNLLFQGTLDELMEKQKLSSRLILETSDNERSFAFLTEQYPGSKIEEGKIALPMLSNEKIALLNRSLVEMGIDVYQLCPVKNDLESVFMDLTNN